VRRFTKHHLKRKNQGLNGTIIASGYPETYGLSGTLNYKSKNFNLFYYSNFNDRSNPGKMHLQIQGI
jgi:hypothetical protein